jgi:hypothetical protein
MEGPHVPKAHVGILVLYFELDPQDPARLIEGAKATGARAGALGSFRLGDVAAAYAARASAASWAVFSRYRSASSEVIVREDA